MRESRARPSVSLNYISPPIINIYFLYFLRATCNVPFNRAKYKITCNLSSVYMLFSFSFLLPSLCSFLSLSSSLFILPPPASFSLSFLFYPAEVAGANGTSSRCYFQIKEINVDASVVLREIYVACSPIYNKTRGCSWATP